MAQGITESESHEYMFLSLISNSSGKLGTMKMLSFDSSFKGPPTWTFTWLRNKITLKTHHNFEAFCSMLWFLILLGI